MNANKSTMQHAAILLLIVVLSNTQTHAVQLTKEITFMTSSSAGSLVSIQGTLNTLAQGLNTVPFGNTSATVQGQLTANVTFELGQTPGDAEVIGFEILRSSFVQQNLELSYQVTNTTRTVQFLTKNIGFTVNSVATNQQLLQTDSINVPADSFQIQQSSGTAQIDITSRPSKQQTITPQQSVLSTYEETVPNLSKFAAGVMPVSNVLNGVVVDINLPLTNQQLIYRGVGLPVTLNYAGGLSLSSPVITLDIPEPSTIFLLVGSAAICLWKHRGVR